MKGSRKTTYSLSRWLLLWMLASRVEQVNCWQSPTLQSHNLPCYGWGALPSVRRPARIAVHSTASPSSKETETFQKDGNTHDKTSFEEAKKPNGVIFSAKNEQTERENKSTTDSFPKHSEQTATDRLSMPWSEVQDWALRDNLPKYTVMIPLDSSNRIGASGAETKNKDNGGQGTLVFALWRTMLKEVPELAGYPIDFLQEVHSRQMYNNETKMQATPQLLPYLEDYTFATAGGVSGKVFGVPGLADGTRIETSAVTNIEVTLPQGFVRTSDGKAAYELGRPQGGEFSDDAMNKDLQQTKATLRSTKKGSYELLKTVNEAAPEVMEDADGMLLRLGASTGILLAGATAVNMLSHHLTVNVFWV